MRTQVAIIGAGPAGMLLSHLLAQDGVESVIVEACSREYVQARIRAWILETSTVELLESIGLGERLRRHGDPHRDIHLQWPGQRHHLDFVDLVGRNVWIYGGEALATRLGHGLDVWTLTLGPVTEKSVLPMRSFVMSPMRHGRLFLAGDAAHIVPPTSTAGATGLAENYAGLPIGL